MSLAIELRENDLKQGVLGLVVALVEIIRDTLKAQALRRMEGGSLTGAECERLGGTLMKLDIALEQMKEELGIKEAVQAVRDGLDNLVAEAADGLVNPEAWREQVR